MSWIEKFFAIHNISTYLSLSAYSLVKSMNGAGVTPLDKLSHITWKWSS